VVFGKEGVAERERKQRLEKERHQKILSDIAESHQKEGTKTQTPVQTTFEEVREKALPVVTPSAPQIQPLETQLASTTLQEHESALNAVKREEIREGIQTVESTREPVSVVSVPKEPVIQEHIHPVEQIEVQPVLHRERKQTEVHQIVQPISQQEVLPAVVQEKTLPPQYIGDFQENEQLATEMYVEGAKKYESTVEVDGVRRVRVVKEPIVEEVIRKTIIEEIQPVIRKETIAPFVIKETLPLYERVAEAPTITTEERSQLDYGLKLPEDKNKLSLSEDLIRKLVAHQEDPSLTQVPLEKKRVV